MVTGAEGARFPIFLESQGVYLAAHVGLVRSFYSHPPPCISVSNFIDQSRGVVNSLLLENTARRKRDAHQRV